MMSFLQTIVPTVHQSYMAASGTAMIVAMRKYGVTSADVGIYSTPVRHDGIW